MFQAFLSAFSGDMFVGDVPVYKYHVTSVLVMYGLFPESSGIIAL